MARPRHGSRFQSGWQEYTNGVQVWVAGGARPSLLGGDTRTTAPRSVAENRRSASRRQQTGLYDVGKAAAVHELHDDEEAAVEHEGLDVFHH